MATCERVVKEPVPPPVEYVLRLSETEVIALGIYLREGAWPSNVPGRGKMLNDILASLRSGGVCV